MKHIEQKKNEENLNRITESQGRNITDQVTQTNTSNKEVNGHLN